MIIIAKADGGRRGREGEEREEGKGEERRGGGEERGRGRGRRGEGRGGEVNLHAARWCVESAPSAAPMARTIVKRQLSGRVAPVSLEGEGPTWLMLQGGTPPTLT